jgi:NAD(P)-dependent dehydrogenase (short-subunit alcohol dehydrogenase family)
MATTPDFSVAGKQVLITGGTGGIGGAFAKAFLDHGANVIVADIEALKDGTDPVGLNGFVEFELLSEPNVAAGDSIQIDAYEPEEKILEGGNGEHNPRAG